jgi:uncharacterized protein YabE (DUF348 family)
MKRKSTVILISLTMILLLTALYNILGKQVTIIEGEEAAEVVCFRNSVQELLEEQEIFLGEEDRIIPGLTAPLKDGMEIVVKRAVPLWVTVDGEVKEIMSSADTLGEVLSRAGIQTGTEDMIKPGINSPVERDMEVRVVRVTHDTIAEEKEIPFETVVEYDDEVDRGIENVVKKGENGITREEILVAYHDGNEVSRQRVNQEVLKEPVNRVVEKGTRDTIATSRGAVRFKRAINMSATAYDATFESTGKNPGDPHYGITRSGTQVRPGVVAVDPKVIPLGTKLYVKSLDGTPDYGFASAEDTGGAIKGNKIDLYYESPEDVRKYGRRKVLVYVLE